MRRMRAQLRRVVHDERGANAVLIAFLIVPMMGFGALALDVSAQHAELGQLQHGADAAAVAVALECAADTSGCTASATDPTAEDFLDGNGAIKVDGAATVIPNVTAHTVKVEAEAAFPHFLASLIDGDDDSSSTTVSTDATAAWGYVGGGEFIPLAIAECEIEHGIAEAGSLGTPFKLLTRPTSSGGGPGPAGGPCEDADYPGGFSWLTDDDCEITLGPDHIAPGDNGNNTGGTGCSTTFLHDLLGHTVLVALYDEVGGLSGSGAHGEYTISKFAAFRITGYSAVLVGGGGGSGGGGATTEYIGSPYNQSPYKFTGSERGLQGYFVEYVSVADALELTNVGGPSDPIVVQLIN